MTDVKRNENPSVVEGFPLGTTLVTYSRWTGWESPELVAMFQLLTIAEILALKKWDRVWVDVGQMNPNFNVEGWVLVQIRWVEATKAGIQVYYTAPGSEGKATVAASGSQYKFARLVDELATRDYVAAHPLALIVYPTA